MPSYTNLKGFDEYGESLISSQILHNVIQFFNWGMLGKGAFFNIEIPTSGAYGGDFSRLRPVSDRRYNDIQIYEGARKEWVWESGVEYGTQPIQVSGVNVDGTFYPLSTTGDYAFTVDYPMGRVVFDSVVSGTVTAEYSYRAVPFISVDEPWFKRVQTQALRVDSDQYLSHSGDYSVLSEHKQSLPVVAVEVSPRQSARGAQIGGGQIWHKDVLFHVIAETSYERGQIVDILTHQNDKKIRMFDINTAQFPLNIDGSIASGALTYPDLVRGQDASGYYYKDLIFQDFFPQEISNYNQGLFSAIVRSSVELWMEQVV